MEKYIGSALNFPIHGRTESGMTLHIDCEQLAYAMEAFDKQVGYLVVNVLPLKPENVTSKKTHSVKLINIIENAPG
jgi:hypothetical protein